jgi:hypothetical protein
MEAKGDQGAMCTANSSKALTLIRNETGEICLYIEAMTYRRQNAALQQTE